jgi:acyl carrier protein
MQGEAMDTKKVEEVVSRFFVEREGEGILEVIQDIDFIEEGIIDSLDLVSLAAYLEANVGTKIDLTHPETLKSVRRFGSLIALVS